MLSLTFLTLLAKAHLQALAVLLVGEGAARLLHRASAAVRHSVRAAAAVLALVLPVVMLLPARAIQLNLPILPSITERAPVRPMLTQPLNMMPVTAFDDSTTYRSWGAPGKAWKKEMPTSPINMPPPGLNTPLNAATVAAAERASAPKGGSAAALVALLLLGGAVVMLSRLALTHLAAWRRTRRAIVCDDERAIAMLNAVARDFQITKRIELLESAETAIPYMRGIFRQTIVLPIEHADWDMEQLTLVLRHELSHVRRGDFLWQNLAAILADIHWFNPLFRRAAAKLRQDSELACDDFVLSTGVRATSYAGLLIAFARQAQQSPVAEAALGIVPRHEITARIEAILDPATPRLSNGARPMKRSLAIAATFLVALGLVDVRLSADEPNATVERRVNLHDASGEVRTASVEQIAKKNTGEAWYTLAWAAHENEDWESSAIGFMRAAEADYTAAKSSYNAACALARLNRSDEAFAWLKLAAEAGFNDARLAREDADLDNIREDSRFEEALRQLANAKAPKNNWAYPQLSSLFNGGIVNVTEMDAQEADAREVGRAGWEAFLTEALPLEQRYPDQGAMRFRVGFAMLMLNRPAEAIERFEAAQKLDYMPAKSAYNIACAQAMLGNADAAIKVLSGLEVSGGPSAEEMEADYDLRSLREDPRFIKLVAKRREGMLERVTWMGADLTAAIQEMTLDKGTYTIDSRTGMAICSETGDAYAKYLGELNRAGGDLFNLAYTLHMDGKYEESLAGFTKCYDNNTNRTLSAYNIACANARLGNADAALEWLEKSIKLGALEMTDPTDDDDFDSISQTAKFQQLVTPAEESK